MDEQLKTLKEKQNQQALAHITFTPQNKQAVMGRANRKKWRFYFTPQAVLILFSLFVICGLYFFIPASAPEKRAVETISDIDTPESLQKVAITGELFTIEWLSDSMDRGNHDYVTSYHSPLVIDPSTANFSRGDVVYYKIAATGANSNATAQNIGRIVGLPGETIEIIKGHVWINERKLSAFYSEATMHGLTEEAYFEKVNANNIADEEMTRKYFSTSMSPVTLGKNEVFVLVDQWWRGIDSKDHGPLQTEQIIGLVKGYAQ